MERRYDLDWVRVCAFGLLVLYHVGMYYVTWDWHVKSPHASDTLEPFMLLSSPWRLSLLFVVSGAATAFLLGKGREGFLRRRSWRLLVPLLFGMFVVVPPQTYYEIVEKAGYDGGWWHFYRLYVTANVCRGEECIDTPTWNHLWFVAYLWVYTLVLAGVLLLPQRAIERARTAAERALSGMGVLLWPLLYLAVARLLLVARFESTHGLVDDWYNHAQYLPLFLLGWLVARATPVWDAMVRVRRVALGLACASWIYIVWYFWLYAADDPAIGLKLLQRVLWAVQQWCTIVAIFGVARRHLRRDSSALRYLRDAVFPVYILHQTLIVVFAHNLKPLGMSPAAEGPLLVALTFAGCLAGYEIVRRVAWLRPLFGLKRIETRV
ncbi:acyltransferase family protein [Chiayiivirga flava]|uniref:Surface polysaccharide O-acyltransferase-like enzyme n=1 Tax=Chiayiivirga flava TaxID=659595 RepID=A0A7W8D6G5_9GAMM|nr:acyltransferase family protein [Chiayiivirga flava]MBB5208799.1 surface polysaccharide O-acyltransferase-like enzyme [Chiayiivirga flava]